MRNNDENTGAAMVMAGVMILGVFLFALMAFVTAIFTLLAVISIFRPITIGGYTITRKNGILFIAGGLLGTYVLPFFLMFVEVFYQTSFIDWQNWSQYIFVAGYMIGAFALEGIFGDKEPEAGTAVIDHAPRLPARTPERPTEPAPHQPRYAEWDDEEARR